MDPTQEPPGGDSDQPEGDQPEGPPAASSQDAQDKPADQEPTQPEPGADATGASLTQAQPSQASAFDRHRTLIILATIAALVLVTVLVGVVTTLVSNASSTANIQVITPAPAVAGGLSRDYADEARAPFQSVLAQFRQRYAPDLLKHVVSYAIAIYTNAPTGSPATGATVAVLYVGFNITDQASDPASAVHTVIGQLRSRTHLPNSLAVTGLPGDTSAECIGNTLSGVSRSLCFWVTDKTASFMVSLTPATTAQAAAVLKKMRPDLERG